MIRASAAIVLLAAAPLVAATSWYDHYERGVRLIEQGSAAEAKRHLSAALAARAEEGVQLPTEPQQYIDYLPHLYLAIAHQMTGEVESARKELALAETSGMAARSEVGRPLLVAYQLLLRGDATGKYPRYAVYEKRAPVLSEAEFATLRNDVLAKCDLPLDTKLSDAPWYANYELGLELERKGDYPRALTHFIEAVANRPNPQKQARMYGMWLIDYYPYFHIARSHVRLENWQCARNALDISQRLGEIPNSAPEMSEWLSLQRETERRLAAAK
jgi:tetratricopeptide (TPR) repeat protein